MPITTTLLQMEYTEGGVAIATFTCTRGHVGLHLSGFFSIDRLQVVLSEAERLQEIIDNENA